MLEALITAFKQYPYLHDKLNPDHKDRDNKEQAWKAIAAIFTMTGMYLAVLMRVLDVVNATVLILRFRGTQANIATSFALLVRLVAAKEECHVCCLFNWKSYFFFNCIYGAAIQKASHPAVYRVFLKAKLPTIGTAHIGLLTHHSKI